MNIWANTVLTDKGNSLLAKLTQGHTLNITRAITGAGFVTPGLLSKQTNVTDPKQSLVFRPVSYPEIGQCEMPVVLTNKGLETGYTATQVGIFAEDPDEGEILFFIAQAPDENKGEEVPSEAEMSSFSTEWAFVTKYGQADSVNVTVDPANTVSRAEMEQYIKTEIVAITNEQIDAILAN